MSQAGPPRTLSPSAMPPGTGPEYRTFGTLPPPGSRPGTFGAAAFQSAPPGSGAFQTTPMASLPPPPLSARSGLDSVEAMHQGTAHGDWVHPAEAARSGVHDVHVPGQLCLEVVQLLDVPREQIGIGGFGYKSYAIHITDDHDKELGSIPGIEGLGAEAKLDDGSIPDRQTLELGSRGIVNITTRSQLIHISVEFAGGFPGTNRKIGSCRIYRTDPRSMRLWAYTLSDKDDKSADCGIELKLAEVRPHPDLSPGAGIQMNNPSGPCGLPEGVNAGAFAEIEVNKVTDLPAPAHGQTDASVVVHVEAVEPGWEERELCRFKDFPAQASLADFNLRVAFPKKAGDGRGTAKAPFKVGGEAGDGAMFLRLAVSYGGARGARDLIGYTAPFFVTWIQQQNVLLKIYSRGGGAVLGYVYASHHLQQEGAPPRASQRTGPTSAYMGPDDSIPPPKKGDPGEVFYRANENYAAQNRALVQRSRLANSVKQDKIDERKTGLSEIVHGHRTWRNLDDLFTDMGPHPVLSCSALGPAICSGYRDQVRPLQEVQRHLEEWDEEQAKKNEKPGGKKKGDKKVHHSSAVDRKMLEDLTKMMGDDHATEWKSTLRPIVCKDPETFLKKSPEKQMSWMPSRPMYLPISGISQEDQQTLRLAQYNDKQRAKLCFADVTPHYRINEDIWGESNEAKAERNALLRRPGQGQKHVKDDCIMA